MIFYILFLLICLTFFSFRTGSKLGISPLMLAAMNGHVPAVKLLLDMGSDINAQIETNRNTALTLACFQGRAEVVSLLLDRKANVEHRAKVSYLLTSLMTVSCVLIFFKMLNLDLWCAGVLTLFATLPDLCIFLKKKFQLRKMPDY